MVALHFTKIKRSCDGRLDLTRPRLFFAFRRLDFYYSVLRSGRADESAARITASPRRLN
jgi:hypothetical protein